MSASSNLPPEQNLVVIGVGLIGGSVAAAVRQRFPDCRITGIGRNEKRLNLAIRHGLLDCAATSICEKSIPAGSLVVICLPVDQIAACVWEVHAAADKSTVITDAGSVKSLIFEQLLANDVSVPNYVGAHPIAGGEQTGFEHAQANLFEGRVCVVTPENADVTSAERVAEFWQTIGSTVVQLSAAEHDRILALTSHLPHVLAAVTASVVPIELLQFTGSGFRDTTRIAAGAADLWTTILLANQQNALAAIEKAHDCLTSFATAIRNGDAESLNRYLKDASDLRHQLNASPESK